MYTVPRSSVRTVSWDRSRPLISPVTRSPFESWTTSSRTRWAARSAGDTRIHATATAAATCIRHLGVTGPFNAAIDTIERRPRNIVGLLRIADMRLHGCEHGWDRLRGVLTSALQYGIRCRVRQSTVHRSERSAATLVLDRRSVCERVRCTPAEGSNPVSEARRGNPAPTFRAAFDISGERRPAHRGVTPDPGA